MLVLQIVLGLLGAAFTLFGYFIYFRKKYSLINGFDRDFRAGKVTEAYAKRVGLIEFFLGIGLLIAALVLALV